MTASGKPSIVLAPMNMAAMPVTIAKALQGRGYQAAHVQYVMGRHHNPLKYGLDRTADMIGREERAAAQMRTLHELLEEGFDIFHFWNRSLVYRTDYGAFSGMDLPLIKARGRKIAYRFTGYDLRLPSRDLAVNPHSPFRYEQPTLYEEDRVKAYQDFLREYVDRFFVQDPEMAQFWPDATIVPRALDLRQWEYVGLTGKERPLVVHAPTNAAAKGTRFVLAAVEQLKSEGLAFDFRLLSGIPHEEARKVYREADIVVDQLLIGATGVMTLEAWALGKAVVTNLRPDLFEPFYETTDLPVANANPDTIVDVLRATIKDADMRQDLSKRGRTLVEARHDIDRVIDRFIEVYDEIHTAPPVRPTGDGDIRYLTQQMQLSEKAEGFFTRWFDSYRSGYRRERDLIGVTAPTGASHVGLALKAALRAAKPLLKRDLRWVWRIPARLRKRRAG